MNIKSIKFIPGLNGLRAISVLIVMLSHFGFGKLVPGGYGVTVFFFISGFLITTLLLKEKEATEKISLRNFYIRRFIRILPELFALIVVSSAYKAALGDYPNRLEISAAFLFFTNYFIAFDRFAADYHASWPQLWSLSVEEHYYIVYPMLFAAVLTVRQKWRWLLPAVIIFGLAYRIFVAASGLVDTSIVNPYTYLASEARFDSIAFGALFAFAAYGRADVKTTTGLTLGVLGFALTILTLGTKDVFARETFRYTLQGVGLLLIFCALYLSPAWTWVLRILDIRFISHLGVLSYGAYLWHLEFQYLAQKLFGITLAGLPPAEVLAYAASGITFGFLAAEISFRIIAKPCSRLKARFEAPISKDEPKTALTNQVNQPQPI